MMGGFWMKGRLLDVGGFFMGRFLAEGKLLKGRLLREKNC
jgi:hypothetical protein